RLALTSQAPTLLPNYPNPFNPETWIPFDLPASGEVTITIYGTRGEVVRRIALGSLTAGLYRTRGKAARWDGRNAVGEAVPSGVYVYELRVGDYHAARRMVVRK
ncbi:MAG: FlgD immunoglobulin-like domain containing protein, partial [Candidatus Poribacteria bacterium]